MTLAIVGVVVYALLVLVGLMFFAGASIRNELYDKGVMMQGGSGDQPDE